ILFSLILLGTRFLLSAEPAPVAVAAVQRGDDGITLKMNPGTMRLQVFSPRVVRVVYGAGQTLPATRSLAVIGKPGRARWTLAEPAGEVCLRTDELEVRVNRAGGAVAFYDKAGKLILTEQANGRSLTPARV